MNGGCGEAFSCYSRFAAQKKKHITNMEMFLIEYKNLLSNFPVH